MKKIITAFALLTLLTTPAFSDDVEIIELESISEPAMEKAVDNPMPSSSDMAKYRLEAERLIQEAYYVVREFENHPDFSEEVKSKLGKARAILIFPDVLKAGWGIGVSGGKGVLLARSKSGEWSYPSFYTLSQVSFGVQLGIESSRLMMVIMNGQGLGAVIDNNFKAGASFGAAVANEGGKIGVGTTTNMRKDIYTYANSKGAFIGAAVDGSAIEPDKLINEAFYGTNDATTQSIILDGQHANTSADMFRKYLSKFKYTYD